MTKALARRDPSTQPQQNWREKERQRIRYQKRLVAIRRVVTEWLKFEKTILANEEYHRTINKLVAQISQKRSIENYKLQTVVNKQRVQNATYSWGTARDEVMTIERVHAVSARFGYTYDQVQSHVAKVANHAKWLKERYANGEGGIVSDINRELEPEKYPPLVIVRPAEPEPLILRASEINAMTAKANEDFEKARQEFHQDDPPKPPTTGEFGFIKEVDRDTSRLSAYRVGPRPKKPRKNWRKET